MSVKSAYVIVMRQVRSAAKRVGIDTPLPEERGVWAHIRSLLGIHDADTLIQWDVPWWTYRAAKAVDEFLDTCEAPRVFEYGSGASTVWLARRAREVFTVEHDSVWAAGMAPRLSDATGVTMHVCMPTQLSEPRARSGRRGYAGLDFAEYVDQIHRVGGIFDLIVIDGRARMACLAAAQEHLAPGGWIVLDNSARRRYQPDLGSALMSVTRYRGAAPGLPYPDETSILRAASANSEVPRPRRELQSNADAVSGRVE